MESYYKHLRLSFFILFLSIPLTLCLQVGFYSKTCPKAETIVQQSVQQRFMADKSISAALLRMHFHDCFVRGCDASILIDSTSNNTAEKDAGANTSVREFSLIDQIKSKLEATCPQIVSCADIIALATRDSIALAGGLKYSVLTGRKDGLISKASEVNLPSPSFTISQAQQAFKTKGLTLNEMVVLLGGHTIGFVRCTFFQDRLSNFQNSGKPDPTMDKNLVANLKKICATNSNGGNPRTFLDQNTAFVFDNKFYSEIKKNRGVLRIDQDLALDPSTSSFVTSLVANSTLFQQSFVNAIVKMGNIQGSGGEIRKNCRVFNSKDSSGGY